MTDAADAPAEATVDADGRLVRAEGRLLSLIVDAGGSPGEPLVVPQLAAMARLARRLRMPVAREVVAAQRDRDLHLWVRAEPDGEVVRLRAEDWRERAAPRGSVADAAPAMTGERWRCDAALIMRNLPFALAARLGDAAGRPLTNLFALLPDDTGRVPLLAALAAQRAFEHQAAELRAPGGGRCVLAAVPVIDGAGAFNGFSGTVAFEGAAPAPTPSAAPSVPGDPGFGGRLDRALRDPLRRILLDAEALDAQGEPAAGQPYAGYAADIASAGRHLLALIDDLIDVEALEAPGYLPGRAVIDLAELAMRAATMLRPRAAEKGMVVTAPGPGERLPARGDRRRVLQVLMNLAENAVRYAPERSAVAIQLEPGPGVARVVVADEGPGIPADDQERIFEKFERLNHAEPGGAGLGLHIARRLARAMGGDVAVDSAPGRGARFVLTLPAAE